MQTKEKNMIGKCINNFNFIKIIGEGYWAKIYLAIDNKGSFVAIKAIQKCKIQKIPQLENLIKTQIKILSSIKNQNVVRFIANFAIDQWIFIAMQYCNEGNLQQYLKKKKTLTQTEATIFLKNILNGFKGLHQVKVIHRDFNLSNVLIHNGVCKIADFGFAKQMISQSTKSVFGTSLTNAPEMLSEQLYGTSVDIWSIGIIYYQMIFGHYPFNGSTHLQLLTNIKHNKPNYNKIKISENCRHFIQHCLIVDPKKRISWKEIYQHELIFSKKVNANSILHDEQNLNDNKTFYQSIFKDSFINDPKIIYNVEDIQFKKMQMSQITNFSSKFHQIEQNRQINQLFKRYSKQYFQIIDNLKFLQKHIAYYVQSFKFLQIDHENPMFILSKYVYLQAKKMYNNIKQKQNILPIIKDWQKFIKSSYYQQVQKRIQIVYKYNQSLCKYYRQNIKMNDQRVKNQFDIEKSGMNKFIQLVTKIGEQYWFQLAKNLQKRKDKQKYDLIKMVQALDYFNNFKSKLNLQEYERKALQINFIDTQEMIEVRVKSIQQYNLQN